MWGRIPQCSVSQATSNKLHAAMTSPASIRADQRKRASHRARADEGGSEAAEMGATMDMNELGSRVAARRCAVRSRSALLWFPGRPVSPSGAGAAAI